MDYHDALATLGIGSAHPGGFRMTLAWLDQVSVQPSADVLDVGCGTGRTACLVAKRCGAVVTGVDIRRTMVDKARRRSAAMGLDARFLHVKPGRLPFPDGSFDVLVAESVTVFNPARRMLREYARVLRQGGVLVETEMCAAAHLPPEVLHDLRAVYGAADIPTVRGWKDMITDAGLSGVRVLFSGPVSSLMLEADLFDDHAEPDPGGVGADVAKLTQANGELMARHAHWLHYAVLVAQRA